MKRISLLLAATVLLGGCTAQLQPKPDLPTPPGKSSSAPLTIEEYRIVEAAIDTPAHFEFRERISADVLAKRAQWRQRPSKAQQAERTNQTLKPFGYELVGDGITYELRKGDGKGILDKLYTLGQVTVAPGGGDFLFVAQDTRGQMAIVRNGRTEVWGGDELARHRHQSPVLVGNDLVTLEWTASPGTDTVAVWKGDKVIYTAELGPPGPEEPVKGLTAWNGHWVLELKGQVIIDGKSLNQETGYEEIFNWRLIDGRPFYFFRAGDRTGLSYDGVAASQYYEKVQHDLCCEPAAFNPGSSDRMVWFYALRDGAWYYVEAGLYQ